MSNLLSCKTPGCMTRRPDVHPVYRPVPHALSLANIVAECCHCGGRIAANGDQFHVCSVCEREVAPGELRGFFVPSRCADCDLELVEKQRKAGHVCRMCGQVFAYCCC